MLFSHPFRRAQSAIPPFCILSPDLGSCWTEATGSVFVLSILRSWLSMAALPFVSLGIGGCHRSLALDSECNSPFQGLTLCTHSDTCGFLSRDLWVPGILHRSLSLLVMPSVVLSGRCRHYFSFAKLAQAVSGKYQSHTPYYRTIFTAAFRIFF